MGVLRFLTPTVVGIDLRVALFFLKKINYYFLFIYLYIYIFFIKSDMCCHFIGADVSFNEIR
jgi:hypothetical protein